MVANNQSVEYCKQVFVSVADIDFNDVSCAVNALKVAKAKHGRVWLCGNGGSASTASHFANDLRKMCGMDCHSLPNDIPSILAYGNDNGWENMFSDAMEPFRGSQDVLVAISCSGASENVVKAAKKAERLGGFVIVLTGNITKKNKLALFGCPTISVNAGDIKIQEDIHLMICHSIVGALQDD